MRKGCYNEVKKGDRMKTWRLKYKLRKLCYDFYSKDAEGVIKEVADLNFYSMSEISNILEKLIYNLSDKYLLDLKQDKSKKDEIEDKFMNLKNFVDRYYVCLDFMFVPAKLGYFSTLITGREIFRSDSEKIFKTFVNEFEDEIEIYRKNKKSNQEDLKIESDHLG